MPLQAHRTAQERCKALRVKFTRVNGRNGAEAFRLAPNSSILLMDENDPIVWLKQTDGAGYATVTPYTVAPTAAGTVSLTAQKDGVAIIGATAAQTVAANGVANLNITAIVRNACGCDGSLLSLVLDGVASVVSNLAVTVEKL